MLALEHAVGPGAPNRPIDVGLVADLLDLVDPLAEHLAWSGLAGPAMFDRIGSFQRNVLKLRHGDQRVDPGGTTFTALVDLVGETHVPHWHRQGAADYRGRGYLDVTRFVLRFVELYRRQFDVVPAGLAQLIGFIMGDDAITDIRWAAYMLATADRETGHTYEPVPEHGRGAGHRYGKPVTWKDATGVTHTHVYYGRGYVQLTWLDNYRRIGKDIGQGDALAITPVKALDPRIAYQVMSYGMTHGAFTGVGLARFIHGSHCDYRHAREIINGLDHADTIAAKAARIEMLLRLATR